MTSKTVMALAIACAWTASAGAGGLQADRASNTEVETAASANESAPWLAGKAQRGESFSSSAASPDNRGSNDLGTGVSPGKGGSGSVGSDPLAATEATEYWLIGSEDAQSGVGASASDGAGGSGSFDSSTRRPDG